MKLKRKVLLIMTLGVLVIVIFCICYNQLKDVNDSKIENNVSVFVNELPDYPHVNTEFVRVFGFNKFWVVDGRFYSVESTQQPRVSTNIYWKIDLSKLSLCGICDDIKLYSSTGIHNNDVIIAEKRGELFLLTYGDVLLPQKYSIEDFIVTYQSNKNTENCIEKLWSDHLSGNYNLNYVAYDDIPEELCLSPKLHPELSYQIFYTSISDNYYSKLPFATTQRTNQQ